MMKDGRIYPTENTLDHMEFIMWLMPETVTARFLLLREDLFSVMYEGNYYDIMEIITMVEGNTWADQTDMTMN